MKAFWSLLLGVVALTLHATAAEPTTYQFGDGTVLTLQPGVEARYQQAPAKPRVVALMVKNATGERALDSICRVLGSQIGAQIASAKIEVIDVDDAVFAMDARRTFDEDGRPQPTRDEALKGDTSRMHLAANAGADYLMTVTLDKFTKTTRRIKDRRFGKAVAGSDAPIVNDIYKLSASYRVADVYTSSAFDGGTVRAQHAVRQTATVELERGDIADGLDEELADELAKVIREKAPQWREAALETSGYPVVFVAEAYDLNNTPIYLPALNPETAIPYERTLAKVAATVEVDGIVRGTTGSTLRLSKGVHQVRIHREGYEDVTLSLAKGEGLTVTVGLRMTEREYARLKDSIEFMHRLTLEREQSQASVAERLGHAKMLEQSGFRVMADKLPDTVGVPVVPAWPVPMQ